MTINVTVTLIKVARDRYLENCILRVHEEVVSPFKQKYFLEVVKSIC